jgi:hypothetical protein
MNRELEVEAGAVHPGASVVDVTGQALLATIEVDGSDALASADRTCLQANSLLTGNFTGKFAVLGSESRLSREEPTVLQ